MAHCVLSRRASHLLIPARFCVMQRPRGRSIASQCALALLAAGMCFFWTAPYCFSNPHHFAGLAPASVDVALEDEFAATHGLKLSSHVPEDALPGAFSLPAEQY